MRQIFDRRFLIDVVVVLITVLILGLILQMILQAFNVYKPLWVPVAGIMLGWTMFTLTDRGR